MEREIDRYLNELAQNFGPRTAFCYYDQGELKSVTYREFVDEVDAASLGFRNYRGAHVGILARSSYIYIVNMLAAIKAGAAAILMNVEESWSILQHQMGIAEVDLLLHDGEYAGEQPELVEKYGRIMLPLGASAKEMAPEKPVSHRGYPEEFGLMLFTSGTSDVSKGVMLTQKNMFSSIRSFINQYEYTEKRMNTDHLRFYLCLPIYHAFELNSTFSCLLRGHTICINSSRSFFQREIVSMECECASMVPSMLQVLVKHLRRGQREKLGKLTTIFVAGAPCSAELRTPFEENGIQIIINYGMSENMVVSTNFAPYPQKAASVGTAFGGVEIQFQDGEIVVRGSMTMQGYCKNPEATAQALQDGWMHTGDLGYLDEDGYLFITGRKKNLIILGTGENVNPEELEALLQRNTDIQETLVVEKNARICAQIYCAPENQASIRAYVDEVNKTVAIYKRIGLIEFREEPFPRTATGKIKRK